MKWTILLVLAIFVIVIGCVGGPSPKSISGIYQEKYLSEKYLDIYPDGRFVKRGRSGQIDRGTYKIEGNKITFYSSLLTWDSWEGKIKSDKIIVRSDTGLGIYKRDWIKVKK